MTEPPSEVRYLSGCIDFMLWFLDETSLRSIVPQIVILGTCGSGKTYWAKAVSEKLGIDHIELDAINHQAGWNSLDEKNSDEFLRLVESRVEADDWVVDGNYASTREIVFPRATHIVWLNFPARIFFPRVVRRSLIRGIMRTELWNGNRESIWGILRAEHPIRWSLSARHQHREQYPALLANARDEGTISLEFNSDCEVLDWFKSL